MSIDCEIFSINGKIDQPRETRKKFDHGLSLLFSCYNDLESVRKFDILDWSYRWVSQRVTPPERQNIGQILRTNHMTEYDELQFLIKNEGRSCQDECYVVKLDG